MLDTDSTPGPVPPATGELPRGWHRITWTYNGQPRYVITNQVEAALAVLSAMKTEADDLPWIKDIELEHCIPAYLRTEEN
jgi:hypothetical protein